MFDVLDSCLVCGQMLCNKCLLQGFHASCIAYPALDYKEAVSSSLNIDKCGSPDANLHMALTFHCEEESERQGQRCCVSFQSTSDCPPVAGLNSTDMSVDKLPKLDDAYINEITKNSSHSILLKYHRNSLNSIVARNITPVIDIKGGIPSTVNTPTVRNGIKHRCTILHPKGS